MICLDNDAPKLWRIFQPCLLHSCGLLLVQFSIACFWIIIWDCVHCKFLWRHWVVYLLFFAVKDAFQKVIAAPRSTATTKVVDDFSVECCRRKMTWPENCALALPLLLSEKKVSRDSTKEKDHFCVDGWTTKLNLLITSIEREPPGKKKYATQNNYALNNSWPILI